jgi:hypothetical protein
VPVIRESPVYLGGMEDNGVAASFAIEGTVSITPSTSMSKGYCFQPCEQVISSFYLEKIE